MATAIEPAAPSISSLIAQSTGAAENVGATALDDVRDGLVLEERAQLEELETSDGGEPARVIVRRRRRKKGTAPRARDLNRRSHVRTSPAPELPAGAATSIEEPAESAPPGKAPKKAELLEMLEKAQNDLATERARHDETRIGELSATLQMVALVGYGMLADMWGPHWALEEKEADALGTTGAVALAPHAEKLTKALPWLAFVATAVQINLKRVKIDQALKRRDLAAPLV